MNTAENAQTDTELGLGNIRTVRAAGIPKTTPAGKVDFHALRVAYTTFIWETGATTKEAQSVARHSDPRLTANTYGRTRLHSLQGRAEALGAMVLPPDASQIRAKRKAVGAGGYPVIPEPNSPCEAASGASGARRGSRTPTPEGTGS